jgi:hypothetical protein
MLEENSRRQRLCENICHIYLCGHKLGNYLPEFDGLTSIAETNCSMLGVTRNHGVLQVVQATLVITLEQHIPNCHCKFYRK